MTAPVSVRSVAEVHGTCDKRFDAVRVALAESLDDADVGASAAVFVDGEPVADLRGGYEDAKRTEPGWATGSLTPRAGGPAGAARSSWSTSTRA